MAAGCCPRQSAFSEVLPIMIRLLWKLLLELEKCTHCGCRPTNDAHIIFKEMDLKKKKPFTLMHCYVELSKYPKWQTKELETSRKKQKKTVGASPGTSTNDLADASSVRTDATSIHRDALEHEQRPDGVKKDKLRKGKADDSACKLSLETVWAANQEKDDIKEAAKNARYAQQFELRKEEIALKKKEDARNEREDARRQFELDERVMLIDTSGMTDMQKQFYQAKQNEILARRLDKYEEICAPQVEVLDMEAFVLNYLKFEMTAPTAKCFLRRFVRAAQVCDEDPPLNLEFLSNYVAELSLLEYSLLAYPPSLVAASAIFLSKFILQPAKHPWHNSILAHYTQYKPSELCDCMKALHRLFSVGPGSNLPATREKYSQHKYKFVGKKQCPTSVPTEFFRDATC
ncbi:Ttam-3A [Hordeum vulgare]|nr:Ttam-3A [Hordeum vulgare]